MSKFANKVAVVTGASRGIGQSILLAFAREGAHAVSVDIGDNSETAEKVAALGGKFTGITADFGKMDQAAAKDIVSQITAATGRVDVLVNNAGITRALACEWAKERINVNAVAPGYIATENTRPIREDEKRNETILARIPEGRWGVPEDIAGSCVFLSSKEADFLNGTIMNVDGGWLSR